MVKKQKRRDPLELITIGVTPPHMAPDTEAERVDRAIARRETRPSPMALSKLPWLKQQYAYRVGYHMLTHGLREHASHPELEMCNVPGAFVQPAMQLMNHICDYILNGGGVLKHGEAMSVGPSDDEELAAHIGFRRIRPGKGGMDHEVDVLRITFLR